MAPREGGQVAEARVPPEVRRGDLWLLGGLGGGLPLVRALGAAAARLGALAAAFRSAFSARAVRLALLGGTPAVLLAWEGAGGGGWLDVLRADSGQRAWRARCRSAVRHLVGAEAGTDAAARAGRAGVGGTGREDRSASASKGIFALQLGSGRLAWRLELQGTVDSLACAAREGLVCGATSLGDVFVRSAGSAGQLWNREVKLGMDEAASLACLGGVLYCAAGKEVRAWDARAAEELPKIATAARVFLLAASEDTPDRTVCWGALLGGARAS
ncbi:unnamed protein product [Prorocentrum cordatum]|uniref:Uncharacterized protein n=1 Tax=Prorocentrum cordatum TaxID=2364126 RepID=A0ABN9WVN1_9DINO|nr:unnamed protein product [Polarella glacialis]